jgi:hypothetical protein
MSRLLLSTALAGLLLTGATFGTAFAAPDMVSVIEVTIDLPAVTNPAAALRFTHVADDLKNAITALLVGRIAPEGEKVGIDISEVELSNTFTEDAGTADTRLVGIVSITDPKDNSNFRNYTLSVDVNQAKTFLPTTVDMTTLKASSDEYYNALIQAFAQTVVSKLER